MLKGKHRRWGKVLMAVLLFDVVMLLLDSLLLVHYWPRISQSPGL